MRLPRLSRLRPFLRRDLRARLVSALVTVAVLTGLTWLGVSALTGIDSQQAHELRVALGLESPGAVCSPGPYRPDCNYDDLRQEKVDREFRDQRALRVAIASELARRADMATEQLDAAKALLDDMELDSKTGELRGDTVQLRDLLSEAIIDLAPLPSTAASLRRQALLGALDDLATVQPTPQRIEMQRSLTALVNDREVVVHQDPLPQWHDRGNRRFVAKPDPTYDEREPLLAAIARERQALVDARATLDRLLARDGVRELDPEPTMVDRIELVEKLTPLGDERYDRFARRMDLAAWLTVRAHVEWIDTDAAFDLKAALLNNPAALLTSDEMPYVGARLARAARYDSERLHAAISDPGHALWQGGLIEGADSRITPAVVRYRSPVTDSQRWQLFGAATMLLASFMLLVVGPVVTATSTAREREAGTLPVLRMTGLSATDLAMAMAIGPNVFALVAGAGLLTLATPILAFTAGPVAALVPFGLLLALTVATHLTAIGLGDALGQRVNAMVVGGLLGVVLLVPGLVGTVMVVGNVASTGLLLGPLPALAGELAQSSGVSFANVGVGEGSMGQTILGYSVLVQLLLGGMCLMSWRRRVEQGWAPLFRPAEGALLALASVGCSALVLLDLSERLQVQTYDMVNLITFASTAFLMPVLGWLLVSSLVRPARASAVASSGEARRAFLRFQVFVALTGMALAAAYTLVLEQSPMHSEKSEVMWATITQGLLVAETAVATLLLASRRRSGKHRIVILGTIVSLLQLGFAIAVYGLEVEHVAFTQKAGLPLMVGMQASPYWFAFLAVMWAAGLGLVLAALMRERAKEDEPPIQVAPDASDEQDGRRWVH